MQLLQPAVLRVAHLVLDCCAGAGHGGGWEGGGEDEAGGEGADRVDHGGGAGYVATDAAVGFAEGAGDDVGLGHEVVRGRGAGGVGCEVEVGGHAGAVGAVHADCVDFVKECQGVVLFGEGGDGADGGDGATHTVDGFIGDDFGGGEGEGGEFGFKVGEVVVFED